MSGNTILITGGASGIGLALAGQFLEAGNEVIICGRREAPLAEAKRMHPALHTKCCDVASEADRLNLVTWACANFRGLNVLVNNAGIQRDIDFTCGIAAFKAGPSEIRVNLEAPIVLAGMFIPHLTGKPDACIINVSSGLGFVPAARMPVYSATKAGIHAFTLALRHQLQPLGIKVFEVVPPAVDTALNAEGRAQRGAYKPDLQPQEFAAAVLRGLAQNTPEIGYGTTEQSIRASRADLDKSFQRMNSQW